VIKSIKVWRRPQINIGIDDICNKQSIDPTNTSTVDSSTIISWSWSLDDGMMSSDSVPSSTYTASGSKKAILTGISDKGCIGKDSVQFEVNPLPVVNYTITESCVGTVTQFNNTTTISSGSVAQTLYSFGDGNSSNLADPTNNYITPGNYNSKLIAVSNFGCKDSYSQALKVHELPIADFSALPLKGCPPLYVTFTDLSSVKNDVIVEWEWSDDQGVFSTTQSADKTYYASGNKNANLKVKSAFGCKQDVSYPNLIEVYPKPNANFSYLPIQPTIIESTVTFTPLSLGLNTWNWNFGDGASSIQQNPIHTYGDTGLYNVRLEVTNTDNCENDTTISLFVEPAFSVHIPNSFSPNGDGLNDNWGPTGVLHGVKGYELLIVNRWGEIIFQTNDVNAKWDGAYLGEPVQEGFYHYIMRYTDHFLTKWHVNNSSLFLMR
jgi:gliding motility-associated-like protein